MDMDVYMNTAVVKDMAFEMGMDMDVKMGTDTEMDMEMDMSLDIDVDRTGMNASWQQTDPKRH